LELFLKKTLLTSAEEKHISLDVEKVNSLFGNMQDILNVNILLLENLEVRFSDWSDQQTIGDVIKTLAHLLKLYTLYTQTYEHSSELIAKKRKKDRQFEKLLESLMENPLAEKLDLTSYLILPVQRVPRYVLLLQDLINNTYKSHPDYDDLSESLKCMKLVADKINKEMNDNENKRRTLEIMKVFNDPVNLVEAHRIFVYEGDLKKTNVEKLEK